MTSTMATVPSAAMGGHVALITGASAGIGAAFAYELARRRYDLILVARNSERLMALADELKQRYGVRAEVLVADLTVGEQLERIEERLRAAPALTMLVNNAGFGIGKSFLSADVETEERMVLLHVLATVRLTRAALPGMVAQCHGTVINVSSMAAFYPGPPNATYGASKAYLNAFSQGLQRELEGTGVRVQALCPGFTHTEFHARAGMSTADIPESWWTDPDAVVRDSLAQLRSGKVIIVPGQKGALARGLARLPRALLRAVAKPVRLWRGVRERRRTTFGPSVASFGTAPTRAAGERAREARGTASAVSSVRGAPGAAFTPVTALAAGPAVASPRGASPASTGAS